MAAECMACWSPLLLGVDATGLAAVKAAALEGGDDEPLAGIHVGACEHSLCVTCAHQSFSAVAEELCVAGGASWDARQASAASSAAATPAAGGAAAGGGAAGGAAALAPPAPKHMLVGLLCPYCLPLPADRSAYSKALVRAVADRSPLPTPELLAVGGASDGPSWVALAREHGLPPGWVSPAAFAACVASAPMRAPLTAAFEGAVATASLALDSLLINAASPVPEEGAGEAGTPAAGAGFRLWRQMSAVRPVPCPNATCREVLAIDAVVSEPRHLTCPSCSTGFCGSCGLAWTIDEHGDSHAGRPCNAHAALIRENAATLARTEAVAAGQLGAATKLCPACSRKIVRYRGHLCHQVTCACGCTFCYCCLLTTVETSGRPHPCGGYCRDYCGCEPCPTCARGDAGRRICGGECSGAPSCTTCNLGNRPETEEERSRRLAAQAAGIQSMRERYPQWVGPRRFRTDAVEGVPRERREDGGAEPEARLRGTAAHVREALQLLQSAAAGAPASGDELPGWLASLDAGNACAVQEALTMLATEASKDSSAPPAAGADAAAAAAGGGGGDLPAASSFADGFAPAFLARRGALSWISGCAPSDLTYPDHPVVPRGLRAVNHARTRPSSLGPLLRLLTGFASLPAPSEGVKAMTGHLLTALVALFRTGGGDAGDVPAAQRGAWAAELASLEGVQALTSVLVAATGGTLPVEHAKQVGELAAAVLSDARRVDAVAGFASQLRKKVLLRATTGVEVPPEGEAVAPTPPQPEERLLQTLLHVAEEGRGGSAGSTGGAAGKAAARTASAAARLGRDASPARSSALLVLAFFAATAASGDLLSLHSEALQRVLRLPAVNSAFWPAFPEPGSAAQLAAFSSGAPGDDAGGDAARRGARDLNGAFASEEEALAEAIRRSAMEAHQAHPARRVARADAAPAGREQPPGLAAVHDALAIVRHRLGLPAVQDAGAAASRRPTRGDRVILARPERGSCLRERGDGAVSDVGVIELDDRDGRPFLVRNLSTGGRGYFAEVAVRLVEGPRAAGRLPGRVTVGDWVVAEPPQMTRGFRRTALGRIGIVVRDEEVEERPYVVRLLFCGPRTRHDESTVGALRPALKRGAAFCGGGTIKVAKSLLIACDMLVQLLYSISRPVFSALLHALLRVCGPHAVVGIVVGIAAVGLLYWGLL